MRMRGKKSRRKNYNAQCSTSDFESVRQDQSFLIFALRKIAADLEDLAGKYISSTEQGEIISRFHPQNYQISSADVYLRASELVATIRTHMRSLAFDRDLCRREIDKLVNRYV